MGPYPLRGGREASYTGLCAAVTLDCVLPAPWHCVFSTERHCGPPGDCLETAWRTGETHQGNFADFLIFGFVVSTNSVEKKDGGLSFGDV